MAALERERCPNDGTPLWYLTDGIGRLYGWCENCDGRFQKSVVQDVAVDLGMVDAGLDDHGERVLAYLTESPGLSRSSLRKCPGMASDRTNPSVARLLAAGKLVERFGLPPGGTGRATMLLYPADYEGDAYQPARRQPDIICDWLKARGTPATIREVTEATGICEESVARVSRDLEKSGRIRFGAVTQPRQRRRGEVKLRTLLWSG
jgi:hypothetical protein